MSNTGIPPDTDGQLRRTASALHSFNRFEIKYLLSYEEVPRLREELAARMEADPFTTRGGYPVCSLYYDSASLRYYWEKIEGLRFRRKLRVRAYGERHELHDDTPVFIEIKQRVNRVRLRDGPHQRRDLGRRPDAPDRRPRSGRDRLDRRRHGRRLPGPGPGRRGDGRDRDR
jgi:hypothetical protein